MAVASKSAAPKEPQKPREEAFFCRETFVPLIELGGIEHTSLDEIQSCDPLFAGQRWDVYKTVFLDTETTGLNGGVGTVAFEIGIGFITQHVMVIRQYVMRDYGEEGPMLEEIASLLRQFETVVTFNGKSFDLPLLQSRMVMNRIRLLLDQMPHLDLLHAARRVYKLRLKRCNLSALESAVLGWQRRDDLPGSQVPQRYFDYIKTKEFALLEDVLRHNLDDVKSLAVLTAHLCSAYRAPESLLHAEDVLSVGKMFLRSGRTQKGRKCLKILGHSSLSSKAHMVLASSYKRERNWEETINTCHQMIAGGEGGIWPYIELAKYYEHIEKDLKRALSYADGALCLSLNFVPLKGGDCLETEEIQRRIERLRRKLSRP